MSEPFATADPVDSLGGLVFVVEVGVLGPQVASTTSQPTRFVLTARHQRLQQPP